VHECRGIILDANDNWNIVCYPYKKFFNYGEPNAGINSLNIRTRRVYFNYVSYHFRFSMFFILLLFFSLVAEIDWNSAVVTEKLDGSLVTLYWYQNGWQVSSTGTPDGGSKYV
jgi:hypothetical protein